MFLTGFGVFSLLCPKNIGVSVLCHSKPTPQDRKALPTRSQPALKPPRTMDSSDTSPLHKLVPVHPVYLADMHARAEAAETEKRYREEEEEEEKQNSSSKRAAIPLKRLATWFKKDLYDSYHPKQKFSVMSRRHFTTVEESDKPPIYLLVDPEITIEEMRVFADSRPDGEVYLMDHLCDPSLLEQEKDKAAYAIVIVAKQTKKLDLTALKNFWCGIRVRVFGERVTSLSITKWRVEPFETLDEEELDQELVMYYKGKADLSSGTDLHERWVTALSLSAYEFMLNSGHDVTQTEASRWLREVEASPYLSGLECQKHASEYLVKITEMRKIMDETQIDKNEYCCLDVRWIPSSAGGKEMEFQVFIDRNYATVTPDTFPPGKFRPRVTAP